MHQNKQTLFVMLLGVVLLAMVIFVATTDILADESPKAPSAEAWTVPAAESNRENPVEATQDSIDYGKLIFASQCTMCHGIDGDGTGDVVERFNLIMPDLTDAAAMKKWTDGGLFYILTNGHDRMPAQNERLKQQVKWDLINYVRTFAAER